MKIMTNYLCQQGLVGQQVRILECLFHPSKTKFCPSSTGSYKCSVCFRSSLDEMRDMGLTRRAVFENIGTSKETLDFKEEIKAEKFKLEFFYSIFLFYMGGMVVYL